ncbi:MAG: DNA primase [Tenericutes bacterium ADurb.Bin087]|nr:MAG: DNA primase [Tenericutes bacterium ADurb.Bin087]
MISPSKQIFNCFVCNTGGNAIRFVALYEKKTYYEAAQRLADMVSFKHEFFTAKKTFAPRDKTLDPLLKAINDLTAYYQYTLLTEAGSEAKKYLVNRGLDDALIKKYKIGFAPSDGEATIKFLQSKGHALKTIEDIGILGGSLERPYDINQGRVIFPLNNKDGQVVGYSARALTSDKKAPKYVNTRETKLFIKSDTLYNYHHAKEMLASQYVYVVEGFLDVIALDRVGERSVVALMGTAFTKEQVALLRLLNKEVRIYLDSDTAGQMATISVIKDLIAANIPLQIVKPHQDGYDPDDILKKEGKAALTNALTTFIPRDDFIFNYYLSITKRDDMASTKKFVNDIMHEIILKLNSRLEVSAMIERLAEASGFNSIVLTDMYESLRRKKQTQSETINVVKQKLPVRQTLNKVAQAERFIVYQMLVYPEARTFFDNHVRVFTHEVHRYIANYLKEFRPQAKFNYALLLNDIQSRFSDEAKINEYTQELLAIEDGLQDVKYDENILNDAAKTLNYERELQILERKHQDELLQAADENSYASLKVKHLHAKRALMQKYGVKK